jgi:hypothetical protein
MTRERVVTYLLVVVIAAAIICFICAIPEARGKDYQPWIETGQSMEEWVAEAESLKIAGEIIIECANQSNWAWNNGVLSEACTIVPYAVWVTPADSIGVNVVR